MEAKEQIKSKETSKQKNNYNNKNKSKKHILKTDQ